ncbi:PPP1R10 [Blepharisma stoltei]|uniref:TFIIS N-terminal domain-containing protein n=1 Tax=Blepharisma stoltei TaxID=1481888 RepID=A0AAU9J0F1_9CILI|nr:unnamed protein product [Blepharisma stoltei]
MKRSALVVELENKLSDMIGPNGGLQEARWIGQFVNLMAETTNVEGRDVLLQALLRTTQNTKAIYGRFSSVGGIEQLGKWIKDHEKNEQSEDRGLLHTILSCLNKLPVTTEILEATMIGKAVKSICKHSEPGLQAKAVALIKKWASAIENPNEVHRPPKPNYNETKIELPKRQKVEEQVPIEEIHSDPETNEYHDFSKKRVRYVNILSD